MLLLVTGTRKVQSEKNDKEAVSADASVSGQHSHDIGGMYVVFSNADIVFTQCCTRSLVLLVLGTQGTFFLQKLIMNDPCSFIRRAQCLGYKLKFMNSILVQYLNYSDFIVFFSSFPKVAVEKLRWQHIFGE